MKDVNGYEGLYAITPEGRLYSYKRNGIGGWQGGFRKPFVNSRGYLQIVLQKKGIRKKFLIHRIVALHFIPNPGQKEAVHHRDHNRHNNRVDNLEWVTVDENNAYNYYQPVSPGVAF